MVSVLQILIKRAASFIPGQISVHFCALGLSSPSLPKFISEHLTLGVSGLIKQAKFYVVVGHSCGEYNDQYIHI